MGVARAAGRPLAAKGPVTVAAPVVVKGAVTEAGEKQGSLWS